MNIVLESKMVHYIRTGKPIIIKKNSRPKLKAGDILSVKETWLIDDHYRVVYKSDVDAGISTKPFGVWNYANNMPERHIRLHVIVESVEKMSQRDFYQKYGKCVSYNKNLFWYEGCKGVSNEKKFHYEDTVYAITIVIQERQKM